MHNIVLSHVVERYQNLDCKTFDQTQRKAQEIVHLDEVVKVDAEQFKGQNQVPSEHEMVQAFHNIFLVFRIVSVQSLDQLRFNETLFV